MPDGLVCFIAHIQASVLNRLKTHYALLHLKKPTTYICGECHNLQRQPNILQEFIAVHHFPVSRSYICKNRLSPQTVKTASGGDVSVKTPRNCSQRDHSTIFPFFSWQSLRQTSHQHEWGNSSAEKLYAVLSGERCPSLGKTQEMALSSMATAFPLTFFYVVLLLRRSRSHISPCYLHTAVIILCSFPFTFIMMFHTVYDHRLCSAHPIQMEGNE